MTNSTGTNTTSMQLSQSEKVKLNRLLMALAKLSPQKRAEIIRNEAQKQGLIKPEVVSDMGPAVPRMTPNKGDVVNTSETSGGQPD